RGWSVPGGSPSSHGPGLAMQNTSVLAMGRAPSPVPMTSRMHPPIPVAAPPYGSIADGWLCVSTFTPTAVLSSNALTPALSLNTDSVQSTPSAINSCVAAATVLLRRLSIVTDPSALTVCPGRPLQTIGSFPSPLRRSVASPLLYLILLFSVLCTQCSD